MSYKFDYVCVVFDATCFFETCMSDWNVTFVLQTETCKCEVVFDKHATQCNVSIERVRISGCRTKISEASGGGCTFDHQRRGRVPQPLCGLLVLLLVKGLVFWAGERHGLAWLDVWGAGGGGGGAAPSTRLITADGGATMPSENSSSLVLATTLEKAYFSACEIEAQSRWGMLHPLRLHVRFHLESR